MNVGLIVGLIVVSVFFLIGAGITVFAHRLLVWWGDLGLKIGGKYPWLKMVNVDDDVTRQRYYSSRWHIFTVWAFRIVGIIFAGGSAYAIYLIVYHLM